MKYAQIGSISHGTLRTEDLIGAFADTLEGLTFINGDYYSQPENHKERDRLNSLVGEAQDAWTEDGTELQDEDSARELVDWLQDALTEFAPPYCFFGAHPGDGSDFGFWPCHDEIDELPHVEDSDEAEALGEDCKHVNDHGNVTVFNGRLKYSVACGKKQREP